MRCHIQLRKGLEQVLKVDAQCLGVNAIEREMAVLEAQHLLLIFDIDIVSGQGREADGVAAEADVIARRKIGDRDAFRDIPRQMRALGPVPGLHHLNSHAIRHVDLDCVRIDGAFEVGLEAVGQGIAGKHFE